jgi:glycolate oxidase iron-sulfur subunit
VVDSAGCGAAMKEYGHLLGTPEATAFSARVVDLSEVVTPAEVAERARPVPLELAYQAPCHGRNVQRLGDAPLELLRAIPGLTLIEPDDEHLCCGSGGIYSIEQPEFGNALLEKKDASLQRTGAGGVVSGNPGCAMQIARAGWEIHHPAELLARAMRP